MGRLKFFGSSLDVLDGEEKVEIKQAYISHLCSGGITGPNYLDPYDALTHINSHLFLKDCENYGKVPIETWLTPKPACEDLGKVTPERYKAFLEDNGCLAYSAAVGDYVGNILPDPFTMIGVDHSQTGGVVRKLSEYYGFDKITLIVLDAHLDIFDFDLISAVWSEVGELSNSGPSLQPYNNRFYCCGNYLKFLLDDRVILPENLFIIGVSELPNEAMQNMNSPAIQKYIQTFSDVTDSGVNIVSKAQLENSVDDLSKLLTHIRTPYVYLSIDMDVGAFSSLYAVRFLNTVGIEEHLIYQTIEIIRDTITRQGLRCLGFDLMEIDVHLAGICLNEQIVDRSYDIASNIIHNLLTVYSV